MAQYTGIAGVKYMILVFGLAVVGYVVGPPLYWHFTGDQVGGLSSCPVCSNDCPVDAEMRSALAECPKMDADMADEMKKSKYLKLLDEMNVQKVVAAEAQRKSDAAIVEAKRAASQYEKEYEKCNFGMESSESAREKAEQSLAQAKKAAAKWEERARALGWVEPKQEEITTEEEEKPTPDETEEGVTPEKTFPTSPDGARITRELHQNLAVAHFIVKRAVDNEFVGLRAAQKGLKLL